MLKLNDHRPLILPLGMISIALSQIVHSNIIHSNKYYQQTWPLAIVFCYFFTFFAARFRRLKDKDVDSEIKDVFNNIYTKM